MGLVSINWHPGKKELRTFSLVMFACLVITAAVLYFQEKTAAASVCAAAGIAMIILGLVNHKTVVPLYYIWMGAAFIMGSIVGRVLITAFYYGLITPIGLIMKLSGRDKLDITKKKESYWKDASVPTDKDRYERQF